MKKNKNFQKMDRILLEAKLKHFHPLKVCVANLKCVKKDWYFVQF